MSEATIHVELRDKTGHNTAKSYRNQGMTPGIFYAHDEKPVPLTMNTRELERLVHQEVNILNVVFPKGEPRKCILREVQRDPVSDAIIHVDIMGIQLTEKIRMTIPLILSGTPVGVKDGGGILSHLLREVEVEGLPLDIPEHITVDVSAMNVGDVVTLEAVPQEKFRLVTEVHHAVANVTHPKVAVAAEEEAGALIEGEGEAAEAEGEGEGA